MNRHDKIKLSIIIPAYNEAQRIMTTLERTRQYLGLQAYESEILVISDGSNDETQAVVEQRFPSTAKTSIKSLEYHPNRGKGYAVRYGMLKGQGDLIMFMDADYSVPIEELEKGIAKIDQGYDIAIASRAAKDSVICAHQNFFRELAAKVYTWLQDCYLGLGIKDTQCGFKLFTKKAAHELFAKQQLDSVIFDPEILWLARKSGFRIAEFPINWQHVADSRITYKTIDQFLFVFKELFKIKQKHKTTAP
jgi:dolichyl-phosphate beta-glucosyltransferase